MIIDSKLMKYVIFKKRTENEVRKKCEILNYNEDYTDEVINYLKDANYINDELYVSKYIKNVMNLKRSSITEIKIDLLKRGVKEEIIENEILKNYEELNSFELNSAINLAVKKYKIYETEKIRKYLFNKGYTFNNISKAIDNLKSMNDN